MNRNSALPSGRWRRALAALAVAALAPVPVAAEIPVSAKVPGAEVLLLGGAVAGTHADAGIELRLAPGWKTYWRYPGDSGVPPVLSWSGSENVLKVEMEWPAPKRFADGAGGFSIGYKGTVLFPLKVELKEPGKPARLVVSFDFAVCEALCMPAKADVAVDLGGGAAEAGRIAAARAGVPVATRLGAGEAPSVEKVEIDAGAQPPRLVIEVKAHSAMADLFVEGPNERWALPLPQKTALPDGAARFALPLDGVPAGVDPAGQMLTLTLVDGPRAVSAQVEVPPIGGAR